MRNLAQIRERSLLTLWAFQTKHHINQALDQKINDKAACQHPNLECTGPVNHSTAPTAGLNESYTYY